MNKLYYRIVFLGEKLQSFDFTKNDFVPGLVTNNSSIFSKNDFFKACDIMKRLRTEYPEKADCIYVDSFLKWEN